MGMGIHILWAGVRLVRAGHTTDGKRRWLCRGAQASSMLQHTETTKVPFRNLSAF